jgi:CO/xanthine dehydrogenase Mo-binding subunit
LERHLDKVAHAVGLEPDEFRRRNFVTEGQTTATSQVIREKVEMGQLLDRALQLSDYHAKREKFAGENPSSRIKKGIGFASFMHGAGFTGSGEVICNLSLAQKQLLKAGEDTCRKHGDWPGNKHYLFADRRGDAGVGFDLIEVVQPDTSLVPNSGPTVASRTCMIVGKLVESAVLGLKQTLIGSGLLQDGYDQKKFQNACREYVAEFGR